MAATVVALLTTGLFSVGGAVLVAVGVAWILAGRLSDGPTPTARQRMIVVPVLIAGTLSYLGFLSAGGGTQIDTILTEMVGDAPQLTSSLLAVTPAIVGGLCGLVVGKAVLDYRTDAETVGTAVNWFGLPVVVALVGYPVVALVPIFVPVPATLWYPAVATLCVLLGGVHLGDLRRRQLDIVSPTATEAALIGRVTEATGFDERRLLIVDATDEMDGQWRPYVSGFGPYRYVFVPRRNVEEYSGGELFAIVTMLAASQRGTVRQFRLVAGGVALWPLIYAVLVDSTGMLAVLWMLGWLLCYLLEKRLVYRSDQAVAELVGAATLADGLEAVTERSSGGSGLFVRFIRLAPAPGDRIARLRTIADSADMERPSGMSPTETDR